MQTGHACASVIRKHILFSAVGCTVAEKALQRKDSTCKIDKNFDAWTEDGVETVADSNIVRTVENIDLESKFGRLIKPVRK